MRDDLNLTPDEQALLDLWERHLSAEFRDHSADAALATMSATHGGEDSGSEPTIQWLD